MVNFSPEKNWPGWPPPVYLVRRGRRKKNRDEIFDEVAQIISGEFRTELLRALIDNDREAVRARVAQLVSATLRRRDLSGVVYEMDYAA